MVVNKLFTHGYYLESHAPDASISYLNPQYSPSFPLHSSLQFPKDYLSFNSFHASSGSFILGIQDFLYQDVLLISPSILSIELASPKKLSLNPWPDLLCQSYSQNIENKQALLKRVAAVIILK